MGIRLRYVGLVSYVSQLFSVLTGTLFILLVTRNLAVGEFGEWKIASLLISYFTFISSVIPYWVTRFRARGYKSSTITGLILNIFLSIPFSIGVILTIPFLTKTLSIDSNILYIATLYVPATYVLNLLTAHAGAIHPEAVAYSSMLFESAKLILGYTLIQIFRISLSVVMIVVLLAMLIQLSFLLPLAFQDLRNPIDWEMAKKWIKMSWIQVYSSGGGILMNFDMLLLVTLVKSEEAAALFSVGMVFSNLISYSRSLASGLYPKLLEKSGGIDESEETFRLALLFAIPSTLGILALSPSLLYLFKPDYAVAEHTLRIMALATLLNVPSFILTTILAGVEKKDIETTSFRELVRSSLFTASSFLYIHSAVSLPLIYILITSAMAFCSGYDLVVWSAFWAQVGNLIAALVTLVIAYVETRKVLKFEFPWSDTIRFLAASLIMTLVILPFSPTKIRDALTVTALGAAVYFSVLYLINGWFRGLVSRTYRSLTHLKPRERASNTVE